MLLKIFRKLIKTHEATLNENRILTKDGRELLVEWHGRSIFKKSGEFEFFFGLGTDITEKRKSEQTIKESEEKYHDAYDQAEFYNDLLVHDINNIINNILSSVELFTYYFDDPKKLKDIKELLEIIREQVIKGAKLVSNIHNLSRLEEITISISSIEVCSVIKDALNSVRKSFQTRNIDIKVDSVDEKFHVQANELLLDVFENVLINAVKYNEHPIVEILIRISKKQKENINYIKLEFIDNGIGITDDRKKEIFQKSYKKDKYSKGMGFGLSIVSKVLTSYNGQIWFEDRVRGDHSKGCNFIMLIPETI
ncbi:MAG: ATP-binding protein [Promethearchaeota archaeon]